PGHQPIEEVAMSRDDANRSLVRAMYDALLGGDLATLFGLFAEDMELEVHGSPTIPFAGRWQGRAGMEEFFAIVGHHTEREPGDTVPEVRELIVEGDKVVALGVD